MWDPEIATVLDPASVEAFYARYLDRVPAPLAEALGPWLAPLRRLTWLRTTTWCAKWRIEAAKARTVLELVQEMLSSADPHEVKGRDYTVRQLLKNPGSSAIAIFTMALGIALTTWMFAIVDGVLPVRQPGHHGGARQHGENPGVVRPGRLHRPPDR